jgi:hypothetical protein
VEAVAARIAEMAVSEALDARDGWDFSARGRFDVRTRDAADPGWFRLRLDAFFLQNGTVVFSLLFGKYCLIMV